MAAMTKALPRREEFWAYKQFSLQSGKKAFKGGVAAYDQSAGKCIPAEGQTDLFVLGLFDEDVDATAAEKLVNVKLKREVRLRWLPNDGTNPVTVNDIGKTVYAVNDQDVSILSTGRSAIGVAWAVDTSRGVAVEMT